MLHTYPSFCKIRRQLHVCSHVHCSCFIRGQCVCVWSCVCVCVWVGGILSKMAKDCMKIVKPTGLGQSSRENMGGASQFFG